MAVSRPTGRIKLAIVAWAGLAVPGHGLAPDLVTSPSAAAGIASCVRVFEAQPDAPESARCFLLEVNKGASRQEAARRLRELQTKYPENPGLELYLAILAPSDRAEWHTRSAAGKYSRHCLEGEFLARHNLVKLLLDQGRVDEAIREAEREEALAAASGATVRAKYQALAKMTLARCLIKSGDVRRAGLLLDEVPPGPLRDEFWLIMANTVHTDSGQLQRAWEECLQLAQPAITHFSRASGLYCQARVLMERMAELPARADAGRIERVARAAITEAELGRNPHVAALAHWLLARLSRGGDAARSELLRCIEAAAVDADKRLCRGALDRYQAAAGGAPARDLDAAAGGLDLENPVSRAQRLGDQMRLSWKTRSFDDFVRDAWRALAAIESLRAQQAGSDVRTGLFSTWSDDYYWFAGRLVEASQAGRCPGCLDAAFGVVERLRARALRETLIAASAGSAVQPGAERLEALLAAEERTLGRRHDATLPPSERQNAASDLASLRMTEEQIRRRPAENLAPATAEQGGFAQLSEVRKRLAPDQAMLSFQIAPWKDWTGDFGGGSWLLVASRTTLRSYRLAGMGREDLRNAVEDLIAHRGRSYSWQQTELYRQLLGPALADLPAGIERLIIIADDHMQRLPFAALCAAREATPLGCRYQIAVVPSATLWIRWRTAPSPPPAASPALVLADPPPPQTAVWKAFKEEGIALPIAPLPAARREADALMRSLGWSCSRRVGAQVSPAVLLAAGGDLRRFALLHFAAHSIVDDREPKRSGIWLSPAPGYDGLLRVREIVKLRLDDRLVVLSTCSSNRGPILRGEGVMSLAHAFFLARARTVVASLWPQADTDAEVLLSSFYQYLGRGASVSAALRSAMIERRRQDPRQPTEAWAGMVVLGDGDLVPFPGGRHPWRPWLVSGLAVIALLVAWAGSRLRLRILRGQRSQRNDRSDRSDRG